MDSIPAIYDAGMFGPLGPVNLAEGAQADVIPRSASGVNAEAPTAWPANYFEQTAGAFAGEALERGE